VRTEGSQQLRYAKALADGMRGQLQARGTVGDTFRVEFQKVVATLSSDELLAVASLLYDRYASGAPLDQWTDESWAGVQQRASSGIGLGVTVIDRGPIKLAELDRPRALGLLTRNDLQAAVEKGKQLIAGSNAPATTRSRVFDEIQSAIAALPNTCGAMDWGVELSRAAHERANMMGAEVLRNAIFDGTVGPAAGFDSNEVHVHGKPDDRDRCNIDIVSPEGLVISRYHPAAIELQKLLDANPELEGAVVGAATGDLAEKQTPVQLWPFRLARNQAKLTPALMDQAIQEAKMAFHRTDRPASLAKDLTLAFEAALADDRYSTDEVRSIDWRSPLEKARVDCATRLAEPVLAKALPAAQAELGRTAEGRASALFNVKPDSIILYDFDWYPRKDLYLALKTKYGMQLNDQSPEAKAVSALLANTELAGARIGEPTGVESSAAT
jgi:hypothetical protein